MKPALQLAQHLALPLPQAVTKKYAWLGISGSGKSYGAGKFVELLLAVHAQTVIVDNVGNWWGLRLAADGKGKGCDLYIFGGEKGDAPLEPTGGALMAEVLIDTGCSCILDISDFTEGEKRRFVTEFAVRLLVLRKKKPGAMMIVWEEMHEICPQRVFGEDAKMVGAVERLTKRGRNYGIGTTMLSQRSAALNKDVLSQAEVLIAFQATGPDLDAVEGWLRSKRVDKALFADLPDLANGAAILYSPSWLRVCEHMRVLPKKTFDSTATPEFGMTEDKLAQAARQLKPLDLAQFQAAMQGTLERAKEHDPTALRGEIARLKKELAMATKATKEIVREVLVIPDKQIARLEKLAAPLLHLAAELLNAIKAVKTTPLRDVGTVVGVDMHIKKYELQRRPVYTPPSQPPRPIADRHVLQDGAEISGTQQRMLNVLADFQRLGLAQVPRAALAVLSKQSPRSSGYTNNLSRLRTLALLRYPDADTAELTARGTALGEAADPLRTLPEYHAAWAAKISAPQTKMMYVLIARYPQSLPRAELAAATDQSFTSSGYTNNLSALRTLGIVSYPDSNTAAATALLFPEGLV